MVNSISRGRWREGRLVIDTRGLIKMASLTFVAKFFWLLVRHRLSPTLADNIVTWDRMILLANLVEELEIDFAHVLILVINERAFKTSTTYPFACLILLALQGSQSANFAL